MNDGNTAVLDATLESRVALLETQLRDLQTTKRSKSTKTKVTDRKIVDEILEQQAEIRRIIGNVRNEEVRREVLSLVEAWFIKKGAVEARLVSMAAMFSGKIHRLVEEVAQELDIAIREIASYDKASLSGLGTDDLKIILGVVGGTKPLTDAKRVDAILDRKSGFNLLNWARGRFSVAE